MNYGLNEVCYKTFREFTDGRNLEKRMNCMHVEYLDETGNIVAVEQHNMFDTSYLIQGAPNESTLSLVCNIINRKPIFGS